MVSKKVLKILLKIIKSTPYYANTTAKQIIMENNVYKSYLEIDGAITKFCSKKKHFSICLHNITRIQKKC